MTNWDRWTMTLTAREKIKIICNHYDGYNGCDLCPIDKIIDDNDCNPDKKQIQDWLDSEAESEDKE